MRWLLALLLLTVFALAEPSTRVDVMFVGAHPDDDSFATATLARFAPRVAVVSSTRGEGGGNAIGLEAGPALGVLREAEQRAALSKLGISHVFYLDNHDSGFTLSAEAAERDWGHQRSLEKLVRFIRVMRPRTVFTMHPGSGHGHHQFIARLTTEAFFAAGDPEIFPAQLEEEGLTVWQPAKLYFAAEGTTGDFEVPASPVVLALEKEALGLYASQGWATTVPEQPERETFVTGVDLTGGSLTEVRAHGLRLRVPAVPVPASLAFPFRIQRFSWTQPPTAPPRVETPPGWRQSREEIVPQGPPGNYLIRAFWGDAEASATVRVGDGPTASLLPIPPLDSFATWAARYGLDHIVPSLTPVYVVGLGETVEVPVLSGSQLEKVPFAGESLGLHRIAPRGLEADLAVVPSATLPFQASIAHSDLWEGQTSGPEDLTARFGLTRRDGFLDLWVEVRDDVVVSNLAAADNRGHWRTDAVEVALDPAGPGASLHTLDTVKIGIVPFNLQGQPMAARDADARPGPVARTLPGLRLASRRTADGYRVEVSLPLAEVGLEPGRAFGFNLLLYDADKADAKPGENANAARAAWSPWPAVQGSPRLWGRVR